MSPIAKPRNTSNNVAVIIVLLFALGNLCLYLFVVKDDTQHQLGPHYALAMERAQNLLSQARSTPRLEELMLDKFDSVEQIAKMLVNDDSGQAGQNLLGETADELHTYQNYKQGAYQYQGKIRGGNLGIYKGDEIMAEIPLEFVDRQK